MNSEWVDKHWQKLMWAFGVLTVSGGFTHYALKGYTATAVEEAVAKVKKEKNEQIIKLKNENRELNTQVDRLQTDAIVNGFKLDLCCAGNPCVGQ